MNGQNPHMSDEVKLIPWWAYVLAGLVLVALQLFLYGFAFVHDKRPPPFPLQVVISVMAGAVAIFFVLLVGYVNRDAKRRNMNSALWTALVIFVPNAIGFILYFLLRQPILIKCPQCAAMASPSFNYCPSCKYSLRPTCPQCKHEIRVGDKYCPNCAQELDVVKG